MGFKIVYNTLLEVFPQLDSRVLRAVAIEHPKDADAAVQAVLEEIIPFFVERSRPSSPLTRNVSEDSSSEGSASAASSIHTPDSPSVNTVHSIPLLKQKYDKYESVRIVEKNSAELTLSKGSQENNINIGAHLSSIGETEENVPESSINVVSDVIPCHTLGTQQDTEMDINGKHKLVPGSEDSDAQLEDLEKSDSDGNNSVDGTESSTLRYFNMSPLDSSVQLVEAPDMLKNNLEKSEVYLSDDTASKMETITNVDGVGSRTALSTSMSQSSQIHIMDVLEETISEAKNNKKTLFSAMESVISLMCEVELKEKAAEKAKEQALIGFGGNLILAKVEELKQMLQHAKEANDMHAGEVYGEKAILATELRELQSRVLSLADERDKSLSVLDQMRQTLEVRLAAAENEIKCVELEKIEKEKAAKKLLADQELIMEQVVKQANILKQQAEDNAKLQEFLLERGRLVDKLQGEIAVICQDVNVLKSNFDDNVPYSKSASSSQTSCILASSSSSLKSLVPDQVETVAEPADSFQTQKTVDPLTYSFEERVAEGKSARDDSKAVPDDGWDLLDSYEIDG